MKPTNSPTGGCLSIQLDPAVEAQNAKSDQTEDRSSCLDQICAAPAGGSAAGSPELFRQNALLAGVSAEAYAAIETQIEVVQFSPGQIIFAEDEPGDCLYLIGQGSVRVSKKGRGG